MFGSDNVYILGVGAGKLALAEFAAKPGAAPVLLDYALGEMGITPESETDATAYVSAEFTRMSAQLGMRSGANVWVALSGQVVFPRFVKLPPSPLEQQERLEQLRALEAGMRIDIALVDIVPRGVDTTADLETARRILAKN